jgi:hypothetical protein
MKEQLTTETNLLDYLQGIKKYHRSLFINRIGKNYKRKEKEFFLVSDLWSHYVITCLGSRAFNFAGDLNYEEREEYKKNIVQQQRSISNEEITYLQNTLKTHDLQTILFAIDGIDEEDVLHNNKINSLTIISNYLPSGKAFLSRLIKEDKVY